MSSSSTAPLTPATGAAERFLRGVVIATIVLPVAVFVAAASLSYRNHFVEARERLVHSLDVIHEHAVKVFETHELVASQVNAWLLDLSDAEVRAQETGLHERLKAVSDRLAQIEDIWVIDADGHPLVAASLLPVPRDLDLSDRDYFRVHRDGVAPPDRTYVSELLRGRANPETTFFQLSTRRETGGAGTPGPLAGVIAVSIEPDYFRGFYAQFAADGFDTISLIKSDGHILARHSQQGAELTRLPAGNQLLQAIVDQPARGSFDAVSLFDGVSRIIAYRQLPSYGVYVTAGIDRSGVMRQWLATMASHLIFGLPATFALVGLTLIALRHTRREAQAMAQLQAETARRQGVEDQLRQAQKMEALGRLTGGVAHDFNNLLTIVIGSLDMLLRRWERPEPRLAKLANNALDGAHRAAALTARLLAFARRQPLDPKPTDVNQLVATTSELFRRTLGESVRIETVLAGGLWQTFVDAHQLEAALLNVAVNARDAMPDGGRLTIETANAHLDDAYAAAHSEVRAGQYVLIAISDTGVGMEREVLASAFEPFFTTKPTGQGTGLGLSQVYGFCKQSDGHVKIYSEPGQGTSVKLYLPRYFGAAEPPRPVPEADRPPADATKTILVVEDEADVRRFTVETLRDLGYHVIEAAGAADALPLLGSDAGVALLLTDVVMPGLNGRKLAEQAARLRPGLPVLYMTGYTSNAIVHNGVLDPGVFLITKPFTTAQLAAKIEQVLSDSAHPPA